MEMVLNNGFCEMSQEELMALDGGFLDYLAEGFGEANGLEGVTAGEVVKAFGMTVGDAINWVWSWF